MKPYYKEFGGFKINTQGIYNAVWEFESSFGRALVVEFRERLEDILFDKRMVDVKFHPVHWRYHRDYYRRWMNKDWKDEAGVSVFYQSFFLRDSRSSGEVKFKSLTDDEKIQIVVPKRVSSINVFAAIFGATEEEMAERKRLNRAQANQEEHFDNLTLERRVEILDNWKNSKYSDDFENDDNPYQYERWAYDIYSLYIPCDVEFSEEDREYFEFFFSWRLNLTDLYDVKLFLDWHLRNTFQDDGDSFKEFVRLLLMKYERIISNPYIINLTNEFLDKVLIIPTIEMTKPEEPNEKFHKKIEWQGTQKELAELFIELHRKGWLREIPTDAIKSYFDKSDSIQQLLKPAQDPKTKEPTYESVFTPKYKPKFDSIRKKST